MTEQALVLVSRERVADRLADVVSETCRALGVATVDWDGGDTLPDLRREPVLLVSMLRAGERSLPSNAAQLLSRSLPHTPLLLLTEERLVRPSVLLHQGKVVLLGAPLTDLRIAARLQAMLSEHRPPTAARGTQLGRAFSACVDHHPQTSPAARRGELPVVVQHVGRSCTGFLHRRGQAPIADADARLLALAIEDGGQEGMAAVPSDIRASTTVVHLSLRSDRWLFHVPFPDVMLSLASPFRAPGCYDVAAAASRQGLLSLCVAARAGDVVWAAAPGNGVRGLQPLMFDGGATLVRALDAHFKTVAPIEEISDGHGQFSPEVSLVVELQ